MNLSEGNWIAIGGIGVAATVALVTAQLQRKQMRQIVLHQQDPAKHPLKPPPSKLTLFVRNNLRFIITLINLSINLGFLVYDMRVTTALGRRDVLSIAMGVAAIFFVIQTEVAARNNQKLLNLISYAADVQFDAVDKLFKSLDLVASVQTPMAKLSGAIVDTLVKEDHLKKLKEKAESNNAESGGRELPGKE
jgi:hypothetical protein